MDDLLVITLITSFVTLLAVGVSHLISEYRAFRHAKYGLVSEIEYNLATISYLVEIIDIHNKNQEQLQETIKNEAARISDYLNEFLPRIDVSSFQFFSQQGYLIKMNKGLSNQLFAVYMNFFDINRILGTYKLIEFESELLGIHSLVIKRIIDVKKLITPDLIDKIQGIGFFSKI